MKIFKKHLPILGLCAVLNPAFSGSTDISSMPIGALTVATPSMIMGVDNSGSMDFEVMLTSNDGAAWYHTGDKSFMGRDQSDAVSTTAGINNYNKVGTATATWLKYAYLFPNNVRNLTDATYDHFAVPPTDAYAYLRSSAYNPLYYNPAQTYLPWSPAYYGSTATSYSVSPSNAAKTHPIESDALSYNLPVTLTSGSANWTFHFVKGMVIPGASIAGIKNGSTSITTDVTVGTTSGYSGSSYEITVPYIPATYYVIDASCSSAAPACVTAPDGKKLKRVQPAAGSTDLSNFANWFTYYRSRRLMLASSMSVVLPQLSNLKMGMVWYNPNSSAPISTPSMYTMGVATVSANEKSLLGYLYRNNASGGTPGRQALKTIGELYKTNTSSKYITASCQRSGAMLVTDGFTDATSTTAGSPTGAWFSRPPFSTITSGTMADLSSYYYSTTLGGGSFATGQVPYDPNDPSPKADKNPNLHMNTYAMTLGAKGTIFGKTIPDPADPTKEIPDKYNADPYTYPLTWPIPSATRSPTAVDDLWHATINGRGKMFVATDAKTAASSLASIIADLLNKSGSGAAVTLSNVNIQSGDNTAYIGSFNPATWYGDLVAAPVDLTTGATSATNALWSFQDTLDAKLWTDRQIATFAGNKGTPFPDTTQATALNTPTKTDNEAVAKWVKGDRSNEKDNTYRTRTHVLGDIVNGEAVLNNGVLYQAANDGMLHAIDASNGNELWAYIPSFVVPTLNSLSNIAYSHVFTVDGTPTIRKMGTTGKTILVGGLRAGGKGYFAIDISSSITTAAGLASKVLWEFPSGTNNNVGLSYGKPLILNTSAGWVVVLSSGYNNTGDYKGHIFILDANDGTLLKTIGTGEGNATTPAGLAHISAYSADGNISTALYAGDLNGNVFKVNLTGAASSWSATRIAIFKDSSGNLQPITTAPEIGQVNGLPMLFFGTGRYLGDSDVPSTKTQSVYGFVEDGTLYDGTTAALFPRNSPLFISQTVTAGAGGVRTMTQTALNYPTKKGWRFDLPMGEEVTVDMQLSFGTLVLNSNSPSKLDCSSNSYQYQVDQSSGGMMAASYFANGVTPWAGRQISTALASRPVVAVLPSGKVVSFTKFADNTIGTLDMLGKGKTKPRKVAWREIRN
jgi:type IV pilus assembly protein PilY1